MTISERTNVRTPAGGAAPGRRHKLGIGVLLLLGLFAGFVGLAPSAGAHHALVQGNITSACDQDGTIQVSFRVDSWDTYNSGSRVLNANVGIQFRTNTTGTFPADVNADNPATPQNEITQSLAGFSADVFNGAFTNNNGGGTPFFTGTFTLPASEGGKYIQVRAYPKAQWVSSGGSTTAPGPWADDSYVIAPQVLPTGCVPPATPSAVASLDCAEGVVEIDFTGVGSATIVDISKNGVQVANDVPVPVGSSTYLLALDPGDENTILDIDLDYSAASATDQLDLAVPVNCLTPPQPSASVAWQCGSDATVTLANAGQESVTADILKDGVVVHDDVAVPGPYTVAITGADEDRTVAITVTFSDAGTATDVALPVEVGCDEPDPTIGTPVCAEGGFTVALGNEDGEDEATFTIVVDGVETSETVPAGETETITITVAEGGTVSVSISSGDVSFVNRELTRDCEEPDATATFDCAEGGLVVLLTNTGESDTTVTVADVEVLVPGGTTAADPVPAFVAVDENAAYDVHVTGDQLDVHFTGTRDGEIPEVSSANLECAEGGVIVVLTNDGVSDTIVLVDGIAVEVPAGTTEVDPVEVFVPVDENDAYDFTVVGDGLDQSYSGTANCLLPEPVVEDEVRCAAGGMEVVLRNTGDDTAIFLISSPALPGGELEESVAPGDVESVLVPLAEGASTTVIVTSDETVLLDATVTRDCETVEGEVIRPTPAPLPRTGADTTGLLGLAAALLAAGGALVALGRRGEAGAS